MNNQGKISYKDSGVDTEQSDKLVENIKKYTKKTNRKEVLSKLGGFSSLASIPSYYKNPLITTCTDGVGTKLKLAIKYGCTTIGQDLVAMCVNDVIVCGAEPFLFLDYIATGKIDPVLTEKIIKSIAESCEKTNCSLVGGETAEMPGMYQNGDYDVAGFCVGIVEKSEVINGANVSKNDEIIAIKSSGCHSNGYSLVRKVLEKIEKPEEIFLDDKNLIDLLLEPTTLYVKEILDLNKNFTIKAIANITGGGLTDNIPRVLPENTKAIIETNSWKFSNLFSWLQKQTNLDNEELMQVFNCDVGMVVVVDKTISAEVIEFLNKKNLKSWKIGYIDVKNQKEKSVEYV